LRKREQKQKKEAEEARRKKEAEAENEVSEAGNENQFEQDDELFKAQKKQQEQQLDELHANATKASFEDRNEYFYKDGSKVIDHEDGHMSIVAGRWSTPEDQAKLAIESAQAKGWETLSTKGFDDLTQEYMVAIGKANDIEVKTEAEWEKLANEQETEAEQEDELEEAPEVEIAQEQEQLEPLADANEQAEEQTIQEKQQQVDVEAEIE
jgi:hypothetical protein